LASHSPRRRVLLAEAGYRFLLRGPELREPHPGTLDPEAYAVHTSWLKARAVAADVPGPAAVLAADTVVAVDGQILGKPRDRDDARRILRTLSGTRHRVYTGVCVWLVPEQRWLGGVACSELRMREWSGEELEAYLDTQQWRGKAGAYGIQDEDQNVTLLSGSYTNVVGLPMELVGVLLEQAGVPGPSPAESQARARS